MPKLELTPTERKALRAAAHPLKPIVLIGDRGLSDSVLREIDLSLKAHELLKIKVSGFERPEREAMLSSICEALSCAPIHHLGKTLIIYRPERTVTSDDINITRAVRKPNEEYVPKKMAAEGLTRTRKSLAIQREIRKATNLKKTVSRSRASNVSGSPDGQGKALPRRRIGSALSLKAGARRGR